MNLDRRLATLEKRSAVAGACPACGGQGGGPSIVLQREGEPRPVIPGCPACGVQRPRSVRVIVLRPEPAMVEQPA